MKLVIAEKPSVAREIAQVLGATGKAGGYFYGNGYQVTWALGHLLTLAMPDEYGINGFNGDCLPIFPNPFKLTIRKKKKGNVFAEDPQVKQQLGIIATLFQGCEHIIVATDAGREGELIFRYIYEFLGCKKPFERLWITSLTTGAIRQGFANLRPADDFEGLYQSALCRSQADWLVGINATQALTIAAGNGLYSLGRVQTPTLAMVCRRFCENKAFISKVYFQIALEHRKDFVNFRSLSVLKWDDKRNCERIAKAVENAKNIQVVAVDKQNQHENPPLLFDLTGLQKEANKRFNFTAEETLNIAQSLYEKQFITYPRTGSKYVTEDMWKGISDLVLAIKDRPGLEKAVNTLKLGRLNRRIVNELKVTDHHGLLTTERIPSALSVNENLLYDLIATRFLEAVSPGCTKEINHITLSTSTEIEFSLKGTKIIEPGWRVIQGSFDGEEGEIIQEVPDVYKGDILKVLRATPMEKQTIAPALYTEATLLAAMENAGRFIENAEERKIIADTGIGTPATRAAIIETLLQRDYLMRQKKILVPTEKGLQVYEWLRDQKIADVGMTAAWERELKLMESGQSNPNVFRERIEDYVRELVTELQTIKVSDVEFPYPCPKCCKPLNFGHKVISCSNNGCEWHLYRYICKVKISDEDLLKLFRDGRTGLIKGMERKKADKVKKFDAYIILQADGNISFEGKANGRDRK